MVCKVPGLGMGPALWMQYLPFAIKVSKRQTKDILVVTPPPYFFIINETPWLEDRQKKIKFKVFIIIELWNFLPVKLMIDCVILLGDNVIIIIIILEIILLL